MSEQVAMNELDEGGMPEPCQPIGCDNGIHLAGCWYAQLDDCQHKDAQLWAHALDAEEGPTDRYVDTLRDMQADQ
jgi:hypothetical protein